MKREAHREHGESAAAAPGATRTDGDASGYAPPRLEALGTLQELTAGVNPTATDGLAPGSALSS